MILLNTPEQINGFRFLSCRGALYLETKGMSRRGTSAYAEAKQLLGIKGKRPAKLELLCLLEDHIEKVMGLPLNRRYAPRA